MTGRRSEHDWSFLEVKVTDHEATVYGGNGEGS